MNNSLFIGGGDMLNTKEFRARMVHAAFNGEETDYEAVIKPVEKNSPFFFFFGLFTLIFTILPPSILILTEGLSSVANWSIVPVGLILSLSFFLLTWYLSKKEAKRVKRKHTLMDYEYTLNLEEREYLIWHRFNVLCDSYPVCIIEQMLSSIDSHDYVNRNFVNEMNKLNSTKTGK